MHSPSTAPPLPRLQAGGNLRDDALYIERQADSDLLSALKQGEVCYVLAPRQMGKSSLCNRTARRLRDAGLHCALLDLNRIGGSESTQGPERWFYSLIKELSRKLDFPRDFADRFWELHSRETLAYRFTEFLRAEVLAQKPGRIVFLFDEIDTVLGLPFAVDDFFAAVRDLHNARTEQPDLARFGFCFIGVATPGELMRDAARTPFNIGRGIILDDFTATESQLFLPALRPLQRRLGDLQPILDSVLSWTAGHPYMTHKLCEALERRVTSEEPQDGRALIEVLVHELFLSRGRTDELNLQYAEKRIDSPQNRARLTAILRLYRGVLQGQPTPADPSDPLQAELRLCGLCRFQQGRLSPRNRIFATVYGLDWLKSKDAKRFLDEAIERWRQGGKKRADYLRGAALAEAQAWAEGRGDLTPEEHEFLRASLTEQGADATRRGRLFLLIGLLGILASSTAGVSAAYRNARRLTTIEHEKASIEGERASAEREKRAQAELLLAAEAQAKKAAQKQLQAERMAAEQAKAREEAQWEARMAAEREKEQALLAERAAKTSEVEARKSEAAAKAKAVVEEKLRVEAQKREQLETKAREGSELELAVAKIKEPGSRLEGLVMGLKAIAAHQKRSENPPERLLEAMMLSAGDLVAADTFVHNDKVLAVDFAPIENPTKRQLFVTGCADGNAYIWDGGTGNQYKILRGHQGPIRVATFSPSGELVLTAGDDGTARVFSVRSGVDKEQIRLVGNNGAIYAAAFSPKADSIAATAGEDGVVRLWDLQRSDKPIGIFQKEIPSPLYAVAFSKNGSHLYAGGKNGQLLGWDVATQSADVIVSEGIIPKGADDKSRRWFGPEIRSVVSSQGQVFQSVGDQIFQSFTHGSSRPFHYHLAPMSSLPETILALREKASTFATGHGSGLVRVTDPRLPRKEQSVFTLEGHQGPVHAVAWAPDGSHLLSAGDDGTARLWDLRRGLGSVKLADSSRLTRYYEVGRDQRAWFSIDGTRLYSWSESRKTYGYWDTQSGIMSVLKGILWLWRWKPPLENMAIGPRGKHLLIRYEKSRLWVTDENRKGIYSVQLDNQYWNLAVSPRGDRYAVYRLSQPISIRDMEKGGELFRIDDPKNSIAAVSFSPDGRRILTLDRCGRVRRLWDAETGKPISSFDLPRHSLGLRNGCARQGKLSADGKFYLVLYPEDAAVQVWNTNDRTLVAKFQSNDDSIADAAFLPDSRRVATLSSNDRKLRLWNIQSESNELTLHFPLSKTFALSSDGLQIYVAQDKGPHEILNTTPESYYSFACHLLSSIPNRYKEVSEFCERYR